MDEEQENVPLKKPEDSILTSVKQLLGLAEDNTEFDMNVMMNINGAIATLTQIGVGPSSGFIVTSKDDTYEDWLEDTTLLQNVKLYLYRKTLLGFDTPQQASVIDVLNSMIREDECRFRYLVDEMEVNSK